MAQEPFHLIPINVTLPTLALLNDIAQIMVPVDAIIYKLTGSLRSITSGTHTVTIQNNAGSSIGSLNWTTAGIQSSDPSITSINANDSVRISITSLGITVADCIITVWLKMPSIA